MRKTTRGKLAKPSGEIRKPASKNSKDSKLGESGPLRAEGERTDPRQGRGLKMCHQVRPRNIFFNPEGSYTIMYVSLQTGVYGSITDGFGYRLPGTPIVETPAGDLIFTGGGPKEGSSQAFQYAGRREFVRLDLPLMESKRAFHGAVYFRGFVYVIGGVREFSDTKECERLDLMERTWSAIPPIRQEMSMQSAVALESTSCLYVFGCRATPKTIFEFNVETMLWRKLSYSLPALSSQVPCFKIEGVHNQFFIIQESKLFSIDPHKGKVQQLKKLSSPMTCYNSQTYYSNGVIYTANEDSISQQQVGRLELTL
jgi:hypothetical protein